MHSTQDMKTDPTIKHQFTNNRLLKLFYTLSSSVGQGLQSRDPGHFPQSRIPGLPLPKSQDFGNEKLIIA